MDLDVCPFCKAATYHHCHPLNQGCRWTECKKPKGGCGAVLDPHAHRALHNGTPVAWPYAEPERGNE